MGSELDDAIKLLETNAPLPEIKKSGALYNVELDVEHSDLLDWDKPLSQQSEKVQKALKDMGFKPPKGPFPGYTAEGKRNMELTGAQVYKMLANTDAEASAALHEAGIPGIRYLDAGSRAAGEGSRNVVIFPGAEHKIEIKGRE